MIDKYEVSPTIDCLDNIIKQVQNVKDLTLLEGMSGKKHTHLGQLSLVEVMFDLQLLFFS